MTKEAVMRNIPARSGKFVRVERAKQDRALWVNVSKLKVRIAEKRA